MKNQKLKISGEARPCFAGQIKNSKTLKQKINRIFNFLSLIFDFDRRPRRMSGEEEIWM